MRLDERIKFIATVTAAANFLIFGIASLVEPADVLVASAIASAIATIVFGAAWRIESVPPSPSSSPRWRWPSARRPRCLPLP